MPDGLDENERDRYRQAWAQPNAMTSMINWYRALLRGSRKSTPSSKIQVPTLVLWGQQDPHISYEMAPLSVDLCEDGCLVTFQDATHWVMHDEPDQVNQLLIEHFSKGDHRGVKTHDRTAPFYMMNLNKYYAQARYKSGEAVSGEQAYNRYAARIAPYLISVGGYPDLMGNVAAVFVGDERSPLHDDWSDFAMVYYPSR